MNSGLSWTKENEKKLDDVLASTLEEEQTMNCQINTKIAKHVNSDNQACHISEQTAEHANLITSAIRVDITKVEVILSEMIGASPAKLRALQSVWTEHVTDVEAKQNEAMAKRH